MITDRTKPVVHKEDDTRNRSTVGDLLHDLLTLGELQGKLFWQDVIEFKQGSRTPVMTLIIGSALAFATAPVLLFACGWMIADLSGWPIWAGLLISSILLGAIPAFLLFTLGYTKLIRKASVMQRSGFELSKNTRWLKRRLKSIS